jgi:hypothetical protein
MESVTYWAAGAWLQKECFSCREEEEVEVLFEVRISVLYVSMERAQWGHSSSCDSCTQTISKGSWLL